MNPKRSTVFGVAALLASASISCSGEVTSIEEAIAVIQDENSEDLKRDQEAEEYLSKNQKASLPVLMRISEEQGRPVGSRARFILEKI